MNKITLPFELYHQMRIKIAQNTLNLPLLAGKEAIEEVFSHADDFLAAGGYVCGDVASVGKPQFNGKKGWLEEEPGVTTYGAMPPPQDLLDYLDTLDVKYKVVRPATSEDQNRATHFHMHKGSRGWTFSNVRPCDLANFFVGFKAYIVEEVEEGGK